MKIIIATGGTGGHLFPAMRVAEECKRQGYDILFLGSFARFFDYMQKCGFAYKDIGAQGLRYDSLRQFASSLTAMAVAVCKAWKLLKTYQPDVVIGFGGYGSFPVVFASLFAGCPALIHEQNVKPGRANAILSKFVKKNAISFKQSFPYFVEKKTILTGCPCHWPRTPVDKSVELGNFGLKVGLKTFLIAGGSQGSSCINQAAIAAIKILKGKLDFQVIHISGKRDYGKMKKEYEESGIPFALFDFLDKMYEAYQVADFVISRAGAVSVSEIACFKLPSVFVPYPFAQGHQKVNASVLCALGAARLIEEKNLSGHGLAENVLALIADVDRSPAWTEKFNGICHTDASMRIMQEAVKIIK